MARETLANRTASGRAALTARLRGEIAARFKGREETAAARPSGIAALDQLLPRRGFERGTLTDWLYAERGNGAGTLALLSAWRALEREATLLMIDPQRQFYPPAAVALGIELERVVLVHPASESDLLWTWEQSLRSPAVAAIWGPLESIEPRAFRRLQLAAEAGSAIGHLVRPAEVRGQPCWCHTQLLVEGGERQRVTVTRARQGRIGQSVELDPGTGSYDATLPFPPAAAMAHPAVASRVGA